ncbi:hypothetical protein [Pseudomonas sp. RIT-To-2]|uniref:hypothetical protein n=1 Tax=Pseudomonas sp. RIT-To-2 TaxID=3462541 RepID=UPI002413A309
MALRLSKPVTSEPRHSLSPFAKARGRNDGTSRVAHADFGAAVMVVLIMGGIIWAIFQ